MQQIMQLSLRAVGSTVTELLADFDAQFSELTSGTADLVASVSGIGMIARTSDGRAFECTRTYDLTIGAPTVAATATP